MITFDFKPTLISYTLKTRILNLCLPAGGQGIRLPLPLVAQLRHSLQWRGDFWDTTLGIEIWLHKIKEYANVM